MACYISRLVLITTMQYDTFLHHQNIRYIICILHQSLHDLFENVYCTLLRTYHYRSGKEPYGVELEH